MKRPKLNSIEGVSAAALIERDRERVANKQANREAKRRERARSCRKSGCLPKHLALGAELITPPFVVVR